VFSISGEGIDETGLISKIDASGDAVIYTNQALSIGTYTLTETGAPKGYYPLEGPMTIEVEKTGNDIEVKAFIGGKEISYPDVIKDHTTGVWTIKVTNQSGTVLPATGGSGTGLFMIAGLILTAGAGILLLLQRAKIM
jgi:LPXTG-motif cell wall-anchored protein